MGFLLFLQQNSIAQVADEYMCNDPQEYTENYEAQSGGYLKPSMNGPDEFFRILVVFVGFSDDNSRSYNDWPANSLPNYANALIDTSVTDNYRTITISDYWDEMALDNYDVIGDIYPSLVVLPAEYRDSNYSQCNFKVMEIIDGRIDFTRYDNWKYENGEFIFSKGDADRYLDMMFVIYRDADKNKFGNFGGIAELGDWTYETTDGIIIYAQYNTQESSGITIRNGTNIDKIKFIGLLNHEFGHYLLGLHTNQGGLMAGNYYSETYALGPWERYQLGYISYFIADQDNFTTTLDDYILDGDALKIPVGNSNSNFFLVENHQRISVYDHIARGDEIGGNFDTTSSKGKGIYIWKISNYNSTIYPWSPPNIDVKTANGSWNWNLVDSILMPAGWPSPMPITGRQSVNRNSGKSDRHPQNIFWKDVWWDKWHDTIRISKTDSLRRNIFGVDEQAWTYNRNRIFSVWSSPSTYHSGNTDLSMQIYSQSGDDFTVKVFTTYSSSLSLPPSKPQFLKVIINNNSPKLFWEPNIEPDVISNGQYKIYRAITTGSEPTSWSIVATINAYNQGQPVNSWVDQEVFVNGSGDAKIFYCITAVDSSNKESLKSEYDWLWFDNEFQKRRGAQENEPEFCFSLAQNYPNPFNPATIIQYSLREETDVTLVIYDILGNTIVTLVNERKKAGNYEVQLDASKFISGIYFYRLVASSFVATKKLIFVK